MRCSAALSLLALCAFTSVLSPKYCSAQVDEQTRQLAHDVFQQLIEINTTDSVGNVTTASEAMQQRFLDAGFSKVDMYLGGPNDRKKNLVVCFKGTGQKKPILFIGHLDVVEARREDWTTDPFKFVEKDGFYYGRGTQDMKESDAILVTTFIRLKKEGYKPDRDLILALTADEEGGKSNGVDWLIKNQRNLIDAEYVVNPDGGGVDVQNGKPTNMDVDATEKLYGDYQLTATNPGGHSSLPVPDNAIYHIADALQRLQNYTFPFELNAITRAYFEKMSTIESGQTAEDMKAILGASPDKAAIQRLSENPEYNSIMHTTCVATRLSGGHANNALPQTAQANVNCRILPGHSLEETRQDLIQIFNDPKITVRYVDNSGDAFDTAPDRKALPPAALKPEVMQPLEAIVAKMWPGIPVIPTMATGASDGVFTNAAGMPTYGISGIALETNDVRAHGKDERVPIDSYYKGVDFYYQLVKGLGSE
ncbi:M20/M25/M40 family metallo-hydrolase [Alloacidobacterium dinghuense]|uniref:M20/M25/M40 family metallo-hydrolase n=1 Tax=Alloacidobacterium dinghuense TaxID=2763107 RepID=A0A7G8BII0_9BACT|nr:M20/M25/M40 family metallo-hydrolase [Alloacidobacterium dinghuense]QNI32350.1 M20/M25/M40 family metallo-hydrolase [Alloacidobacterium dinghuense]